MAVTTVAQLAAELNRPAATLLDQLQSAGVAKKSADDALTDADKARLLDFLRTSHGSAASGERKKISITRKSTSEIKQADASGKARTIQVEVRKKRTFVKRDDAPAVDEPAAPVAPVIDEAELARRADEARQHAELLRRQEEELAEKRRQREEQEQRDRDAAEARAQAAVAKAASEMAAGTPSAQPKAKAALAAAAAAPAAEPAKPALRVVKAAETEAAEKTRLTDLERRRKVAETEAAAIRAMMNAPKKVMLAKKPEEAKPVVDPAGIKGTIHKPATRPGAPAAAGTAKPGDKKSVKSEKLSSSWADDAAKKRALKTRGDTGGGARPGWRAPKGGRGRGERSEGNGSTFVAPAEAVTQEVHVPETITVADLAHKMSVKASEVVKQLMKLGQMVTINQSLDQETAMILVEEMGHKAFAAKLDDPEAFTAEEARAGRDRDGPRRPRQDLVARLHPQPARGGRRSGRHHAAHRRLPRADAARHDHLPRHAWPRRVHGDARARGQGHRHRDPGGGGR
jgi:translation initiation factor IF-2